MHFKDILVARNWTRAIWRFPISTALAVSGVIPLRNALHTVLHHKDRYKKLAYLCTDARTSSLNTYSDHT